MITGLYLSPRSGVHGPQPCAECGGLTSYWFPASKRHVCPPCAHDADENIISIDCYCAACSGEWTEVYEYRGISGGVRIWDEQRREWVKREPKKRNLSS